MQSASQKQNEPPQLYATDNTSPVKQKGYENHSTV